MGLTGSHPWAQPDRAGAQTAPITLNASIRTLDINGKGAKVLGLVPANGSVGISVTLGQPFRVELVNQLSEPTLIHWHGLHPPNAQDGVPRLTQDPIPAGGHFQYDFAVAPAGTH